MFDVVCEIFLHWCLVLRCVRCCLDTCILCPTTIPIRIFEQRQNKRHDVAIRKLHARFSYGLEASKCAVAVSAATNSAFAKILKRSRSAVQWNGSFTLLTIQ